MHPCPGLYSLELLHRPQYSLSHRVALQIAAFEHGIRPRGSLDRRVLAVLLVSHIVEKLE